MTIRTYDDNWCGDKTHRWEIYYQSAYVDGGCSVECVDGINEHEAIKNFNEKMGYDETRSISYLFCACSTAEL